MLKYFGDSIAKSSRHKESRERRGKISKMRGAQNTQNAHFGAQRARAPRAAWVRVMRHSRGHGRDVSVRGDLRRGRLFARAGRDRCVLHCVVFCVYPSSLTESRALGSHGIRCSRFVRNVSPWSVTACGGVYSGRSLARAKTEAMLVPYPPERAFHPVKCAAHARDLHVHTI